MKISNVIPGTRRLYLNRIALRDNERDTFRWTFTLQFLQGQIVYYFPLIKKIL